MTMTAIPTSQKTTPKSEMKDSFAWIVLRFNKRLQNKAQNVLEHLHLNLVWDPNSGEVAYAKNPKMTLPGSNIVDIVHHAIESEEEEPFGYRELYRFLPQGCTTPKQPSNASLLRKKMKKKREKVKNKEAVKQKNDKRWVWLKL